MYALDATHELLCYGLTDVQESHQWHCHRVLPFCLAPNTKFWPHVPFSSWRLECVTAHGRHRATAVQQVQHLSPSRALKSPGWPCCKPHHSAQLLCSWSVTHPAHTEQVSCFRVLHVRFGGLHPQNAHSCAFTTLALRAGVCASDGHIEDS